MRHGERLFRTIGPEGLIDTSWTEFEPHAFSYIIFCFKCGDVYTTAPLFMDTKLQPYKAIPGKCRRMGCQSPADSNYAIAGHVRWFDWPPRYAPLEVHRYEFLIELAAFDDRHKELELCS